ncbi:enoyl-CoA hydratase [Rhodoplanes serenus]|uniref:Enoyl-CoA hydratase domain-containing protein 3, mitochondrial n=1 Tax=Rhodoplanes serenus TaxID=200615 RepID=A0A9X4XMK7_9BRAD|nr:enoyl-CoA hydratase [Rhodoplanes serenus]MTW17978.1 enoyl-CoA hydratase [Rhodoplanes serenus]
MPLTTSAFTDPALANRTSASAPIVRREDHDRVALVVLDRPKSRNALSDAMLAALAETFAGLAVERRIRAVVLAAEGPVFCAGHDLKEMTAHRTDPDRGRAYFADLLGRCAAVMQAVVNLPQPVIAAVNGTATAAGCQLVASCDLAVAAANARFCTPGVDIGLFCSTPMVALSRNVAPKHAMAMLLTGDMVDAAEAARIGLVNRVVEPGRERAEALVLAERIAAKSAVAIRHGKRAFYRQRELPLADAYHYAATVMTENMMARDAEEGIDAFIGKRRPTWEDQ